MIRQTSIMSYYSMAETDRLKEEIVMCIQQAGRALTDSEIIECLGHGWERLEPRVRRHELAKYGRLKFAGKRKCTITKKRAMVWWIV